MHRRTFLRLVGGSTVALGVGRVLTRAGQALAQSAGARRLIIFYFPDGVAARSQDGEPSAWRPSGGEASFTLGAQLGPLERVRRHCLFLGGLTMGQTDAGSHSGGAKKLLTGVDGGGGESIDQYLARTVGASSPWRHLYLGVMANQNNASGDKHIVYPSAGRTIPPEDDPRRAFERVFGAAAGGGSTGNPGGGGARPSIDRSVLDNALAEVRGLRDGLAGDERAKLELHLEALRDLERRVGATQPTPSAPPSCGVPPGGLAALDPSGLYDPRNFPANLRLQLDIMVQAMACGLTRVGTVQCSHHTSELIMSRFPGVDFSDPGFDMRSHQASHYGPRHDPARREYRDFVAQRRWFVDQFAYLIDQLAARPEGDGTMLDHSLLWLCTEVSDGNLHSHDDMPFVLAGGAGGRLRAGRAVDLGGAPHGDLLVTLARAMGDGAARFGQAGTRVLPGVLS
jgi:hypothetical protein